LMGRLVTKGALAARKRLNEMLWGVSFTSGAHRLSLTLNESFNKKVLF